MTNLHPVIAEALAGFAPPRVEPDMPAADYHAHPAVSKSLLDRMAKSPLHARAYLDGAIEPATPAMLFGTALHTAVLEPARYAAEYAVFEGDRRTKDGKATYEKLIASGKSIISAADADVISAMVSSILQHPVAAKLLTEGVVEHSVFWTHPRTGLECKARPDYWRQNHGMVVDLKTTEDASPAGFARSIAAYRYHVQAAHYLDGTMAARFVFIAIEKKAPYAVGVYELDPASLTAGASLRARDIEQYASCVEFNAWPGYSPEIQTIALPKWATNQEEI
jgi:exodeoxyribonuclease VIII|nr:MAG TPA: Exodeoxyribonuclease 8 [Caudoviricetes sp.]